MFIILLAFLPIFTSYPAIAETKIEYDAKVAAAQAKVDLAMSALSEAQANLSAAQQLQNETTTAILNAEISIQNNNQSISDKTNAVNAALAAVEQAQYNYDNLLIGTPIGGNGETISGLRADIYNFSQAYPYPNRSIDELTFCKTITVSNIAKDWGGGDMEGCGGDFVMIHYTGYLTVPNTTEYRFLANVDDGWYMTLDDAIVNDNWVLKGCGGWWSSPINLEANRSYKIDAWMYEYGGGACNYLYYLDQSNWGEVPAEWFSQNEKQQIVYTKNPELLVLLNNAQQIYNDAVIELDLAQKALLDALTNLQTLQARQSENIAIIELASNNLVARQEELSVAQQELQAIPPFKEPTPTPAETEKPAEKPTENVKPEAPKPVPPTPAEPSKPELPVDIATVDPQELSEEEVAELVSVANEILNNSEQGSPEYEQALDALFVAAQADDIVLSEELAAIPGAEALVGAINFMGNVGSDMSPKVREESKKIVVTAVVAVGAAVNAATGAAMIAAPSAGSTSSIRRNQ